MNFERLWHWQPWAPNLGNNLELPEDQQLTIDIGVGLTKVELREAMESVNKMTSPFAMPIANAEGVFDEAATNEALLVKFEKSADEMASGLSKFVRLGTGSHSINGKPLTNLRDYLRFCVEQPGAFGILELFREIAQLNSIDGTRALFLGPPAGGSTSTRHKNSEPEKNQTGGH